MEQFSLEEFPDLEAVRRQVKERVWLHQVELMNNGDGSINRNGEGRTKRKGSGRLVSLWPALRIPAAAAVILALGLCLFLSRYRSSLHPDGQPTSLAGNSRQQPAGDSLLINRTARDQLLVMADGSSITLSPGSRIAISNPWPAAGREIRLNGAALFNVTRDNRHPFIVYAKGFSTTALGTVFSISAYDSAGSGQVRLLSGKVIVRNLKEPSHQVILEPGDGYAFNERTGRLALFEGHRPPSVIADRQLNAPAVTMTGETIRFDNAPLAEVFKTLSEEYKTSIIPENGSMLRNRKFTGIIRKERPLDQILATLVSLNELELVRTDSTYIIKAK